MFTVKADGTTNNWPDYHIWLDSNKLTNGAYSAKFPAGNYKIRVRVWGGDTLYNTVYYNGVTAKNDSATITVAEDQTTSNINFSMTRAQFATITGTVTDENGSSLSGWAFVDLFTFPETGKLTEENRWDYWAEVIEMYYDQSSGTYRIKVCLLYTSDAADE